MLSQQQREIAQLRGELSRQRAVTSNVSQLSVQLDTLMSSVTDRVAGLLQERHQADCILCIGSHPPSVLLLALPL